MKPVTYVSNPYLKRDRQWDNVTLRRLRVTTVAVGKLKYYTFRVSSLSYPARKANAPYHFAICALLGSTTFFHTISYTARFSEKVMEHEIRVFFSTAFVSNISYPKRAERDINEHRSSREASIILVKSDSNLNFLDGLSKKILKNEPSRKSDHW